MGDLLSKFVAEVDEVLSGRGQCLSKEWDGVSDVQADGGHIGTGVSYRLQVLPWNLARTVVNYK